MLSMFLNYHVAQKVLKLLVLHSLCLGASAQEHTGTESKNTISLYMGQGADHNLLNLLGNIITGSVDWDKSYFVAASYGRTIGRYQDAMPSLTDSVMGSIIQGYEIVALKHHGLQDNLELGVAYTLKSPYWTLGAVQLQAGTGLGLSHAFSRPSYEDGPFDDPDRRYQTQLMLLFDLRMRLKEYPRWSIFARVQHRSGAYGVIAPQNVGSNFLAAGFSYGF